ncbi:MAG: bifunctional 5,10-methylenetetrahydrofolate dehydrogenase/5,10-methenyltetrahydrofolate cyclohydrolase [Candidatus Pelethousia sp.]|nr:bifunctional 5,10-methylenetetrahydrofolate dehydrogenase/5,10-methenyltetrahydrofolate cyclohydrolase [Candidatus Pelethousia sp.]
MAQILKGAPVVEAMNEAISREAAALKAQGVESTLAILRVGEREDDIAYERGATKRCEKVGVAVRRVLLPADVSQDDLIAAIEALNRDGKVHGVLLFRPLPKHINDDAVRNALAPQKDIDGITDLSLAGVFANTGTGFAPCTAQACMEILEHYGIGLTGKKAVVVGRSLVVGKPAAMMMLARNATVTVCHTRTVDMPAVCREAEILIVSAGRAGIIDKNYFSPGQIVIDVGINVKEDGSLCGDVNFADAEAIVEAVTPVPGGVGTVTTSVLVKHVVEAAKKQMEAGA